MTALFITIIFLIIIACIFTVIFALLYNKLQDAIIRINEVEGKIDESLRKKYDFLNRSISIIKGNIEIKDDIFEELIRLRSRKLNNFDLDRKLVIANQEFLKIRDKYSDLDKSDEIKKIADNIEEIDDKLIVLKEYYDNNISEYNKLLKIFPSNIIASICKYKEKVFFDKKDMTDDDINDFKL